MPDLLIRIKKKNDGSAALSCIRADGTTTWQQQNGKVAAFFPLHDLTHYAVETTLGFRRAFYGLLAAGWDISSFNQPDIRDRMPPEAGLVELIVGTFDLERATSVPCSADDLNWQIQGFHQDHGLPPTSFRITDDQVERIRRYRDELFARWRSLPSGETLELSFDRAATTSA